MINNKLENTKNLKIIKIAKEYLLSFEEINEIILQRHLDDWKNRKPHSSEEK